MKIDLFDEQALSDYHKRTLNILKVTERLTLQYGYSKVTMEDIARESSLGKGTLYLHWKSKDNLYYALLSLVSAEVIYEIIKELEENKDTVIFDNLLCKLYIACCEKKIINGLFTRDSKLLGKLLDKKIGSVSQRIKTESLRKSLDMYRIHGMIRTDVPVEVQLHSVNMLLIGMFNYNNYISNLIPLHEQVIMFKTIIKNSFIPDKASEVKQELFEYVYSEFQELLDFYRKQVFSTTLKL
ncbi:TetR/AcrR family transcriptional regulator [Alkaliphilus peptidifermentans]|uniref:Transcriptional regulator, TetR family n=1 Tax=Alkaliphilus peptidifermentans DSM 18978 TaxID=1120976 RepID=A0A1G5EVL1_9FIRM|nr:helix-turn-helix domain-containing protein [Alkaliphilus peptidifermentans]SCY30468.1 transcriptional regulator, TetR family [Alkaliphilus peptidifermentans DSM 18978]